MYDVKRDPLGLTNLAHATHSTRASEMERARLHQRLSDVMRENGTAPDEIRWPEVDDYRPSTEIAAGSEREEETERIEEQLLLVHCWPNANR
jgi:hypothetical protein